MSKYLKIICITLISTLMLTSVVSCKSRGAHNEYRDAKVRVSERELAKDKKHIRKGNRAYKKQLRKNRKHLFGRARAPKG